MRLHRLLARSYYAGLTIAVLALLITSFAPQQRIDQVRDILAEYNLLDVGKSPVRGSHEARASQGSACMPTTGTVSGLTFAQDVNAALAALITANSGASAPANDCSAAAVKGQVWLDTSTTPNILKQYDGTSWLVLGYFDLTNHYWTPPIGGGTATIASATTADLWSAPQSSITVSGTTTITALANASAVPGTFKIVKFSGALTLTYNATSLVLPGGVSITTAAGDYALVVALTSTNVAVVHYAKADGTAVINPAVPVATKLDYFGYSAPTKFVFGYGQAISRATFPDYFTAVSSIQSVTRTSGSAVLTGFSDTNGFGAGMPVEGTGIPTSTTVLSVTSTTVTLSANASSSGTSNATVILTGYGSGGDSTTVGVADCRGRGVAGRDDMGGTAASRLTSTYLGTAATAVNASGGAQTKTIGQTHLPNVSFTNASQNITVAFGFQPIQDGGANISIGNTGGAFAVRTTSQTLPSTSSQATSNSISVSSGGAGTAFGIVAPTLVANCIIRVLSFLPQQHVPVNANDNAPVVWRRVG